MKIISGQDLFFKLIYCLLMVMTGSFLLAYSGNIIFLYLTILTMIFFCMILFHRVFGRLKAVRSKFPGEWENILNKYSRFYSSLDEKSKKRFRDDMKIFLSDFSITGADSIKVDDETKILIAAGVATVLHGRDDWEPPFKDGVVVYPGETFTSDFRFNRGQIAGMAGERKPLIVTKEILRRSFEYPDDGYNSLIHEIAHYFDFENRDVSGVPIISGSASDWKKIIEKERKNILAGKSFLRSYGSTNDSEFFAVATEFFFERPGEMYRRNRELYNILKNFYNLDMRKYLD